MGVTEGARLKEGVSALAARGREEGVRRACSPGSQVTEGQAPEIWAPDCPAHAFVLRCDVLRRGERHRAV